MSLLTMHRQTLKREQRQLINAQNEAAKFLERIADKQRSLATTTSSSRRQSLQREIDRLRNQHASATKNIAIYQGKVASCEAKVQRAEQDEQKNFARNAEQSLLSFDRGQHVLARRLSATSSAVADLHDRVGDLEAVLLAQLRDAVASDLVTREHDLFLSYASSDEDTAKELYTELTARGLNVWFAPLKRELGVSVMRQIDKGIASSRIGIVFITQAFLQGRYWTEMEMGAFFSSRKRVIPILVDVTHEALAAYSPILSDMMGLSTEREGFDEMAEQIAVTLQEARAVPVNSADPSAITRC